MVVKAIECSDRCNGMVIEIDASGYPLVTFVMVVRIKCFAIMQPGQTIR